MCSQLIIAGNLAKKIQKLNPERKCTNTERVWLSDFKSDSDFIPDELKIFIQSFQVRNSNGNPGGRKGRR